MDSALLDTPVAAPEAGVGRVRELLEAGQFAAALAAAQALLAQAPENRDLLYMLAVSQRYLQRIPEALATLGRLEKLHPGYPRLFQERGHCHVGLRAAAPAIEAFERAVKLNPALRGSWQALELLYNMVGLRDHARHTARELAKLTGLPAEVVTAFSMFYDGETRQAEQLIRQFLLSHGDHVEAMRLLAMLGVQADVLDDAELLYQNILRLAPDYHAARYEYATVLLKRHKHVAAREQMEKLLGTDPDNRVYRTTHASICAGFGAVEQALPLYRELVRETPADPELHLSIGHVLKTLGESAEAVAAYRAAARCRPSYGDAWWSLADMKTFQFTDEELTRMRAEEAAPQIPLIDRYHLCFAIGKALEDRGEYAGSFAYYERGNALKKPECRYRPVISERNTALQRAVCTREFFAARAGFGCDSSAPIFIVGLPRAGSTLIEQILASHSRVEGTMELADIPRLVQDLNGHEPDYGNPRYPAMLAQLPAAECRRLGEKYLADTLVYRSGMPHFIDKMPNNFRHLGLIHLILPNAKLIDARREPMACCFSNFKQLYASGQQFTYSLEDLGRYYRSYVELMAHWQEALRGRILTVQHEELVADLEGQVRRILEFCGLGFEPACVEFHKTARRVHTASSAQVRQPINREGLDAWRSFEPWLGPLRMALGDLAPASG
jgi:predicted Zn-dependent protease